MERVITYLKIRIKDLEYLRDNLSQPRIGIEIMNLEMAEFKRAVEILEKEGKKCK